MPRHLADPQWHGISSSSCRGTLRIRSGTGSLVHHAEALCGSAVARDLCLLDGKLVVVCYLLVCLQVTLRKDNNVLTAVRFDHLAVTVWLAAVIHEAGDVAAHGRV
eukprot:CAMPEP_0181173546 /NCGR_PEP_ID=MMETSP1096-20121128/3059_1 /TAXON_ID=156174 ORGANISM="Chrysochromulina ericina, Strain CCMP281" /NCGR_SAMPLE_ID=MMETSP1096 /ASSEMBLY_ACC=CAM_ASM_000453 /LENGTH=105 /DNA_ID=CAMNT_0023261385 /DNA_START=576 /DNA_END=893 /DNA_ORIENTATION=-